MTIVLQYTARLETLKEACVLFIEQKPFMRFMIQSFNLMGYVLLTVYALKAYEVGLGANEYAMIGLILLWVFYRVRFNRWLIGKRLKNHPLVKHPLTVRISSQDLTWQCGEFSGQTPIKKLTLVLHLKNGYIVMTASRQYLWIPTSAFRDKEQAQFLETLKRLRVRQRRIRKRLA